MSFWRSLTGRMFKLVFGLYLVLAIGVTSLQLVLEYISVSRTIASDLNSLAQSFGPSMAEALWAFNKPLMSSMAKGISQSSIVTGVAVEAGRNNTVVFNGEIPRKDMADDFYIIPQFQYITISLDYRYHKGIESLGSLTIYSDRGVIFSRLRDSLILILVNSFTKTLGLWLIFYYVISKSLSRPLAQMEEIIAQIELTPETREVHYLNYQHHDELGRVISAMNKMHKRLIDSFDELDKVNRELEVRVNERTSFLTEALEFNKTILLNSPLPMGVYKSNGQCILVNEAYAKLVGATHEELLSQNFNAIPSWKESNFIDDCQNSLVDRCARSREISVVSSFGKTVSVDARILPAFLHHEVHLLFQFIDLTERKLYECELIQAKDAAEAAARAKSDFLANMSHEIRTPMNAILGLAQVISRTPLSTYQRDCIVKILLSGKSLLSILNDILDYSKVEAGHLSIDCSQFSLQSIIDNVSTILVVSAQKSDLKTSIEVSSDVPEFLIGDGLRLEQVLINLAANAVKFTNSGEVIVKICVQEVDDGRVTLRFRVIDTGIGISEKSAALLFSPFSQVDASATRRFGGTGLGLAISKRIVELMGGEIGVESEEGLGSTFWFTARFGVGDGLSLKIEASDTCTSPLQPIHTTWLVGLTILVVEDNSINQDVARRILELEGAKVEIANDGLEAVGKLQNEPKRFDVVLMDVQMPVMGGYEATQRIRSTLGLNDIPIIALSAGVLAADRQEAQAVGMNDFVPKPFDADLLVATVARYCGREVTSAVRVPSATTALCAAFDPDETLRRAGGNRELAISLLTRFTEQFATSENELAQFVDVGNKEEAILHIHTLRSVAGNIGAQSLSDFAAGLESKLRIGSECLMSDDVAELGKLLNRTLNAVSTYVQSLSKIQNSMPTTMGQHYCIEDFRTLLEERDVGAIDAFEAIHAQLVNVLPEAQFLDLKRAVYSLQFDVAAMIVRQDIGERAPSAYHGRKMTEADLQRQKPLRNSKPSSSRSILDTRSALVKVGMSQADSDSLLMRFKNQFLSVTKDIAELLEVGDIQEAVRHVHRLKGAAGNIGAQELADVAANIEYVLCTSPDAVSAEDLGTLSELIIETIDVIIGTMASREAKNRDLFARILAHEIRTPLAIIDSNCQLIAMDKSSLDVEAYTASIRTSVKRLTDVLDRCLTQNEVANKSACERSPVDLKAILATVTEEMQRRTDNHIVTLQTATLPDMVTGDASLLVILLTNLVENAVIYSPEGGGIEVTARTDDSGQVAIEVRDDGIGIQDSLRGLIFERFNRIGRPDGSVGAGQGLYIVRRIAELHGGSVACESVVGEGSTFRVTLQP